ncbi:hypothetical protein [Hymenobacter sp. YC55]|uniref:hypothetical protein n=1 Tax=Hymenobacter sp. YC55 TaxID=3034019 RepID=UPI0023F993FC|nr:hypothetical protein [Hymenobacter sp. YC55]MDF7810230.1 hypothetical protein [Hymenobacter sp. YC55]
MVEVTTQGDNAVFEVKGLHKLWAFKSQIEIPLKDIRSARQDAEALKGWWHGFRAPGTYIPGLITAGTFYEADKVIFWDVHNAEKAVIIDVVHDEYNQLIVEVEDPAAVITLLTGK